jgi:hypothetical protein
MTRERHSPTRSSREPASREPASREPAQRHTGRSETNGALPLLQRHDPCQRVSGALSESRPGNDLPFGHVSALSADIVGESHGIGLSVLWTVLSDRSRLPLTR